MTRLPASTTFSVNKTILVRNKQALQQSKEAALIVLKLTMRVGRDERDVTFGNAEPRQPRANLLCSLA
jgi:hypothetical protein